MNLWSEFQKELFSIFRTQTETNVCFDGGGTNSQHLDPPPLTLDTTQECTTRGKRKCPSQCSSPPKKSPPPPVSREVPLKKAKRKLMLHSPVSKSLQSQAAKRLLEKAKKVTLQDGSKKSLEKKFVLPVRSARSSRVIKPNKRFVEEEGKVSVEKKEKPVEVKPKTDEPEPAAAKPAARVILREARLQLEAAPRTLTEGPFSSPTPKKRANLLSCGVCGAVRFYKFLKQTTKFGIRSCESCRKFIAKVIKGRSAMAKGSMRCQQGTGLCMVPAVVRNPDWSSNKLVSSARCQACWLKLCLKNYLMPAKLKSKLMALLPAELRVESALPPRSDTAKLFPVPDTRISFFDRSVHTIVWGKSPATRPL